MRGYVKHYIGRTILLLLAVVTGGFTLCTYIGMFTSGGFNVKMFAITMGGNFLYFCAVFGFFHIKFKDSGDYHHTITKYTYDPADGSMTTSYTTPDDMASWFNFWASAGLVLLCYLGAPISQIVFIVILGRVMPFKMVFNVLIISLGIALIPLYSIIEYVPRWTDTAYEKTDFEINIRVYKNDSVKLPTVVCGSERYNFYGYDSKVDPDNSLYIIYYTKITARPGESLYMEYGSANVTFWSGKNVKYSMDDGKMYFEWRGNDIKFCISVRGNQ